MLLARIHSAEAVRYCQPAKWGALRSRTNQLAPCCEGMPAWIATLAEQYCDTYPQTAEAQQVQAQVEASERTVAGVAYARRLVPEHMRAGDPAEDDRLHALPGRFWN